VKIAKSLGWLSRVAVVGVCTFFFTGGAFAAGGRPPGIPWGAYSGTLANRKGTRAISISVKFDDQKIENFDGVEKKVDRGLVLVHTTQPVSKREGLRIVTSDFSKAQSGTVVDGRSAGIRFDDGSIAYCWHEQGIGAKFRGLLSKIFGFGELKLSEHWNLQSDSSGNVHGEITLREKTGQRKVKKTYTVELHPLPQDSDQSR
jgi:hypothetical protein